MEYSNLCYPFIFYKKKVNKLCCIVRLSWVSWLDLNITAWEYSLWTMVKQMKEVDMEVNK